MSSLKTLSAKEVIEDIRSLHGVSDDILAEIAANPRIAKALAFQQSNLINSVKELATGLYQEDTHFVLELLQNADDNKYSPSVAPAVTFTIKPGRIRIDCNEQGFSEADVRAICQSGASTKKNNKSEGYIGEKGIGFKSVFKVASIVYVRSGDYSFKFDTTLNELGDRGMLAPTWTSFPDNETVSGGTQILLILPESYDARGIQHKFEDLQQTLLLFLRRLKVVTVNISEHKTKSFHRYDQGNTSNVFITERISTPEEGILETVYEYMFVSEDVDQLPHEPKRAGIVSTKVRLAFPLLDQEPLVTEQLVYAYLPVKDFGFSFLIQADFLLSSSREDIQKCEWNSVLRSGVVQTFGKAVDKFNQSPTMRYTWPNYLPIHVYNGTFLSELGGRYGAIFNDLKSRPVVWSHGGTLQIPNLLTHVPERFLDRHHRPLLGAYSDPEQNDTQSQLCPDYPTNVLEALECLGVKIMDNEMFIERLVRRAPWFSQLSREWHEDLASVLCRSKALLKAADFIPLIPLRNGRWISPSSPKPIYFPTSDDLGIPKDVNFQIVDRQAQRDPNRKSLFQLLGVKHCDQGDVCSEIIRLHKDLTNDRMEQLDLLAHAIYIYQFGSRCKDLKIQYLRLRESEGSFAYGSALYIDAPGTGQPLSKLLGSPRPSNVRFLHPSYIEAHSGTQDERRWIQWLINELQVSDIPRLKEKGRSALSPAILAIAHSQPSWVLLKILTENWVRYAKDLNEVRQELSLIKVRCVNDKTLQSLSETILPLPHLKRLAKEYEVDDLPFLDIGDLDIDSPSLMNLKSLGVTTAEDSELYLTVLKSLYKRDSGDISQLQYIYRSLHTKSTNAARLLAAFTELPLIFVPSPEGKKHRWVHLRQCVWKAPSFLQSKIVLCNYYPGLQEFFTMRLRVPNATMSTVVEDIILVTKKEVNAGNVEVLKNLIIGLNSYVKKEQKHVVQTQLSRLDKTAYIPVREPGKRAATLMVASDKFFVADRKTLQEEFAEDLPFLNFTVDEVRHMQPLIQALKIGGKSLLACVSQSYEMDGSRLQDTDLTKTIREKSVIINRCAYHFQSPKAQKDSDVLLRKLRKISVTRVEKLLIVQKVRSQGFDIVRKSPAQVFLRDSLDHLAIFLPSSGADMNAVLGYLLPQNLVELLEVRQEKAASIFSGVLLQSGKFLEKILDDADISLQTIDDQEVDLEEPDDVAPRNAPEETVMNAVVEPMPKDEVKISLHLPSKRRDESSQQASGFDSYGHEDDIVDHSSSEDGETGSAIATVTGSRHVRPAKIADPRTIYENSAEIHFVDNPLVKQFHQAYPHLHNSLDNISNVAFSSRSSSLNIVTSKPVQINNRKPLTLKELTPENPEHRFSNNSRSPEIRTPKPVSEKQRYQDLGTGFAGEYFVVENLRKVLRDFDPEKNWTSNLRDWAQEYDHYRSMTDYNAAEISDITYKDRNGELTQWLLDRGCLRVQKWLEASPTYHIEVKTTTAGADEPFSMSGHQLQLAESMAAIDKIAPEKVYIIIRLCNFSPLQPEQTHQIQIYVDPWALIQEGSLVLRSNSYLVYASI